MVTLIPIEAWERENATTIPIVIGKNMTQSTLNTSELKQLVKEALKESLLEQRDLLYEVFTEVLEDVGLSEAIREGLQTERVTRHEVFKVLEENV